MAAWLERHHLAVAWAVAVALPAVIALIWLVIKTPPPDSADCAEDWQTVNAYRAGLVPVGCGGALLLLGAIAGLSHMRVRDEGRRIGIPTAIACVVMGLYVLGCAIDPEGALFLILAATVVSIGTASLVVEGPDQTVAWGLAAIVPIAGLSTGIAIAMEPKRPGLQAASVACWVSLLLVVPTLLFEVALAGVEICF